MTQYQIGQKGWLAHLSSPKRIRVLFIASIVLLTFLSVYTASASSRQLVEDPFCLFDTDSSGMIERPEAVSHVTNWLLGLPGPAGPTDRDETIDIVTAYLTQTPIDCDP